MTADRFARVQELFVKAAELDAAARARLLDDECPDDELLREEVESLLAHDDSRTILAMPTRGDALSTRIATRAGKRGGKPGFVDRLGYALDGILWRMMAHRGPRILVVVLTIGVVAALGAGSFHFATRSIRKIIADKLQTAVEAQAAALAIWVEETTIQAEQYAARPDLRRAVAELVTFGYSSDEAGRERLARSTALAGVRAILDEYTRRKPYYVYAVIDPQGVVLATDNDANLGIQLNAAGKAAIAEVFAGQTSFDNPFPQGLYVAGWQVNLQTPMVWIHTPVLDDRGDVVASLSFGRRADPEIERILTAAEFGESGETYLFDEHGVMLSDSRFSDSLRRIGLIDEQEDSRSMFRVRIADPGGDLTSGYSPKTPSENWPLTTMVKSAIAHRDGVNVTGYRDYRGVRVVGAWRWLEQYDLGIATELDYDEAYATLQYPVIAAWALVGLLAAAALGMLISAYRIVTLRKEIRESRKLGQYTLEEKIGEGGMGVVYRARHAMLRRPTAVKVIRPETADARTIARFEREVQIASQLSHPHTIEIYDYGRTVDNLFYFAMEYVPGVSLAELVAGHGPLKPARVISLLAQICGSLKEMHHLGLVHRDLKPGNIMVGQRGGCFDFVKVLDFGLARGGPDAASTGLTGARRIIGTPAYMAPERITAPAQDDPRSDLYALGAIGYFLLAGQHAFRGNSQLEVIQQVLQERPRPLSELAEDVPRQLERLVMACLNRDPAERPQTVDDVLAVVQQLQSSHPWSAADAEKWWRDRQATPPSDKPGQR